MAEHPIDACALDSESPSFPTVWLISSGETVEGWKTDRKTQFILANCASLTIYVSWHESTCSHGACVKPLYKIRNNHGEEISEFGRGFGCVKEGFVILSGLTSYDSKLISLTKENAEKKLDREEFVLNEDVYSLSYIDGVNYAVNSGKISIMNEDWPPKFHDLHKNVGLLGDGLVSKSENLLCFSKPCGIVCVNLQTGQRTDRFVARNACSRPDWLVFSH